MFNWEKLGFGLESLGEVAFDLEREDGILLGEVSLDRLNLVWRSKVGVDYAQG